VGKEAWEEEVRGGGRKERVQSILLSCFLFTVLPGLRYGFIRSFSHSHQLYHSHMILKGEDWWYVGKQGDIDRLHSSFNDAVFCCPPLRYIIILLWSTYLPTYLPTSYY